MITIDPNDPRPIYVQIIDEICRALVIGTLPPGQPLPSVRELAVRLRINPNTVSQAYRELERRGVVEVRRGQGTFPTGEPITSRERRTLARGVASRAIREAYRHGLGIQELLAAIRDAANLKGGD